MGVGINVTLDHSAFDRALEQLSGREFNRAATRALNDTARQANRAAARMIAKESGAKVSRVRKFMSFHPARADRLVAEIDVSGRPVPLVEFQARQTAKGVTARAWGVRRLYPGTFLATMATGHTGVFRRQRRGGRRVGRFPIEELHGPSFPAIFGGDRVRSEFQTTVSQRLPVNLQRQIEREIWRATQGARRRR